MSEQTGTFYAVSVGPGDPELLTLQAVRVLENTPVADGVRPDARARHRARRGRFDRKIRSAAPIHDVA